MTERKRATIHTETPRDGRTVDFGGMEIPVSAILTMRDADGRTLTDAEVEDGFRTLDLVGFCVKHRYGAPPDVLAPYPTFGRVVEVGADTVHVHDHGDRIVRVPRAVFHAVYQLD